MNVTVTIDRTKIMGIVEALSATIAQHNGTNFEQLWASPGDHKRLDIWYRAAINDLEQNLMRYVTGTSAQFDLSQAGVNYTLCVKTDFHWGAKLQGLLANKVQDYVVHASLAGWLSDFAELHAPNYTEMSASDLTDIANIILYRQLSFKESTRNTGDASKDAESDITKTEGRTGDEAKTVDREATETTDRTGDTAKISEENTGNNTSQRVADEAKADDGTVAYDTTDRTDDTAKTAEENTGNNTSQRVADEAKSDADMLAYETTVRTSDDDTADYSGRSTHGVQRNSDNSQVHHCKDETIWNGFGVPFDGRPFY